MFEKHHVYSVAFVALHAALLLAYGAFIVMTYWSYFNLQLQLRSPDLAGLPEDVVGFGFWMWWPFIALVFVFTLVWALAVIERRVRVAIFFLSAFTLFSVADYYLYGRLVRALLRG